MILLTPCQYESLRKEIEILKNEKMNGSPSDVSAQSDNIQSQSVQKSQSEEKSVIPQLPQSDDSSKTDTQKENKPTIDKVVELLPKNIRNKGKLLLSHIEHSSCLTWDSLLHIIISGKVMHRSNLADLLKYVLQTGRSPSFIPNHVIEFLCCLKKANVPQTLLNATARKKIQTIKNDDISNLSSESRSANVSTSSGGGGDSILNVDTFSVPPPGIKSLEKKNKRKKSFVWIDY